MGLLLAYGHILPAEVTRYDFSMYVLYVLMFLVGMSIGNDFKVLQALKEQNCRIFLCLWLLFWEPWPEVLW